MGEPRYPTPNNPFVEALTRVVGSRPPIETKGAYGFNDLSEEEQGWIQDWCSVNARPEWATGLSMIEAAELIVKGAVENGNISPASRRG